MESIAPFVVRFSDRRVQARLHGLIASNHRPCLDLRQGGDGGGGHKDPAFSRELKDYLFTDKAIAHE
jgi:hypothetical protein